MQQKHCHHEFFIYPYLSCWKVGQCLLASCTKRRKHRQDVGYEYVRSVENASRFIVHKSYSQKTWDGYREDNAIYLAATDGRDVKLGRVGVLVGVYSRLS